MRDTPSPAREFAAGIRAVLPLLIGVAPFGLIYGVVARTAGMPAVAAQGMSVFVFAGAAQFLAVQLLQGGAPWGVVLVTTAIINSRHLLYGASLAPYLKPLRPAWKCALAYLLVDEVYALAISRYRRDGAAGDGAARDGTSPITHWYALGCGILLFILWQVSTAAGIFLGARVPPAWSLDFTLPLTFIGLLASVVTDRAAMTAAAVAGGVALIAATMPLKLGLMLAAAAGIAAGLVAER